MEYRRDHEVNFSEMTEKDLDSIFVVDEYNLDSSYFQVLGYDIEAKDILLVEALQALTGKKRNVVLLSYFLEMTDAEIAREMKLVHSTIREHRIRSLELLKKLMEQYGWSRRISVRKKRICRLFILQEPLREPCNR